MADRAIVDETETPGAAPGVLEDCAAYLAGDLSEAALDDLAQALEDLIVAPDPARDL